MYGLVTQLIGKVSPLQMDKTSRYQEDLELFTKKKKEILNYHVEHFEILHSDKSTFEVYVTLKVVEGYRWQWARFNRSSNPPHRHHGQPAIHVELGRGYLTVIRRTLIGCPMACLFFLFLFVPPGSPLRECGRPRMRQLSPQVREVHLGRVVLCES